ncbi:hypothetical protein EDWATA_01896 [Edwardsiella tarda ATCC 23685]|uniref:Lambda phage tail tube protein N-terminal domain-containing protein n=1 Tax=Edwardsiella tarda ATCC 23685 TaxID=500638 RepID=D4F568_EDWTA|nr:phage tail tube protein [Edwardsiella tarda]EFE23095.1 hypothetical protein EDWATA_01896 [Edwardsiella tarda ATCC 23685]UCQ52859.1 phage tail protein [Edwardsiella tarda]GAC63436.1 hypothetical protein ET1_05_01230 [Edwardsiella tarda ATCC 15947 = NBRC 105688]STD45849.1 Uncharacterised protein [Edwardsiella tarda]
MTETLKSEPVKGAKTTLWYYIGRGIGTPKSPEDDWRRLGKVKSLQPGELQTESEDDFYLDDENAEWKQSTPGQKSVSALSATLAWMPGDPGQQALMAAFMMNKNLTFRIKYPNGVCDFFTGHISKLGKQVTNKDTITRTIEIQPSGKPILAEELIPALTGIKISAAKYDDSNQVSLSGSQGKWTATSPVSKGRISLTVTPVPTGAALPPLNVTSADPEKALVADSTAPDITPLNTGEVAITVSGAGFSDKVTLTLS